MLFLSLFFVIYFYVGVGMRAFSFFYIYKKAKRPPKQPFQREKGYAVYFSVAVPSALYTTQPRDEFLSVVW